MAAAMLQIASDRAARMRLEQVARNSVMQRFHLAQVTDRYEAVYANLASEGRRSRATVSMKI
jgi:hypothetical protein